MLTSIFTPRPLDDAHRCPVCGQDLPRCDVVAEVKGQMMLDPYDGMLPADLEPHRDINEE